MRDRRQRRRRVASVGVASIAVVGGLVGTGVLGAAGSPVTPGTLTPVAAANTKATGFARSDVVSRELEETPVAKGADAIENPTPAHPYYGYDGDGPQVPAPGDVPADGHIVEATKTEPDKNTYLVLSGQRGADPHYDYGTHFLFQGHEGSGEITAHQPRRGRRPSGHPARVDRHERCSSSLHRRLDVGPVGSPAAVHLGGGDRRWRLAVDARTGRCRTSPACSVVRATRESRTTVTATSGWSRTAVAPPGPSTTTPSSPTASSTGSSRETSAT